MQTLDSIQDFIAAWQKGKLCLHPTDTIPGLSFRPDSELAWQELQTLKGREANKTCIALLADWADALAYWQPLPEIWQKAIPKLWPGPLSIVWRASQNCPASLVRADGTVAFRVPSLKAQHSWLYQVLKQLDQPFPTTSVNRAGDEPFRVWQDAWTWLSCQDGNLAAPAWVPGDEPGSRFEASTVVSIMQAGTFEILRPGPMSSKDLEKALRQ